VALGLQTVGAMPIRPSRIARVFLLIAGCSNGGLASPADLGAPPADLAEAAPPDLSIPPVPHTPTARALLGVVALADGRIAAFDGLAAGALPKSTDVYSPSANQWSPGGATVKGRYGFAAALGADGKVYAIGGTPDGMTAIADTESYDPTANSWHALPPLATARVGAVAAGAPDGRVFVITGRDENKTLLTSVEIWDPAKQAWSSGPAIPTPRFAAAGALGADGKIYVLGGRNPMDAPLDVVEVLDPASGTWSTGTPLPSARYWFAVVAKGTALYAIGGMDDTGFLDNVDAYDTAAKSWSSRAPMLEARGWLGAAAGSDGRIYVVGGSPPGTASFPPPSVKVMAYDVAQDAWHW
jgi:N-acetylneuraminic acid mutarotase